MCTQGKKHRQASKETASFCFTQINRKHSVPPNTTLPRKSEMVILKVNKQNAVKKASNQMTKNFSFQRPVTLPVVRVSSAASSGMASYRWLPWRRRVVSLASSKTEISASRVLMLSPAKEWSIWNTDRCLGLWGRVCRVRQNTCNCMYVDYAWAHTPKHTCRCKSMTMFSAVRIP